MDLQQIIATLRGDLDKLEQAIEALEQLRERYRLPKSRGGRTWMGVKERKAVSERMTRYWETWRERKRVGTGKVKVLAAPH